MPLGEGNGIHIKKDFLFWKGVNQRLLLQGAVPGDTFSVMECKRRREEVIEHIVLHIKPVQRKHLNAFTQNVSAARCILKTENDFHDVGTYCYLKHFYLI